MLTQRERSEISNILKSLTADELRSLANTVSKGQISCKTDEDCIKAILAFETNTESFLHRKLISKKILAEYAHGCNLAVGDCQRREDYVRLIQQSWSAPDLQVEATSEPKDCTSHTVNQSVTFNTYNINVQVQTGVNIPVPSTLEEQDFLFGKNFCQWFFNMLNNPDPLSQGFGPTHFTPNGQMHVRFISQGNSSDTSHSKSENICRFLLQLCLTYKWNPNISEEGMKVKSDPHGLKIILVCGTVFKQSVLCGSFEQSFGLVKDGHLGSNWKIHVIALKCSEQYGSPASRLEDPMLEKIATSSLLELAHS